MASYKLGPIIGELGGGGEVTKVPISVGSMPGAGDHHLYHVEIPEGEAWVVACVADYVARDASASRAPTIVIGEHESPFAGSGGIFGTAVEVYGPVDVIYRESWSPGQGGITGHVWAVKL